MRRELRHGLVALGLGLLLSGCGMGVSADPQAGASALSASAVIGLPRCDASLLHPRITVGDTAVLPGKQIVFVDGVMACVDDAARVDQLVTQIEGRALPLQPAAADDARARR